MFVRYKLMKNAFCRLLPANCNSDANVVHYGFLGNFLLDSEKPETGKAKRFMISFAFFGMRAFQTRLTGLWQIRRAGSPFPNNDSKTDSDGLNDGDAQYVSYNNEQQGCEHDPMRWDKSGSKMELPSAQSAPSNIANG